MKTYGWELINSPGFPGRFLFFLAGGGCCWEMEPLLLLLVDEGTDELKPWRLLTGCCWTSSPPLVPEEKLPPSPAVMFDIGGGQKDKTKLARDKENFIQNFCLSSPASLIPPNSIVSFSLMGKGFCFLPPICIFSQMGIFFFFFP